MTNPVSWWEIQAPSIEDAQAFYGGVFGWTFQPFSEGYHVVLSGGTMIGGLVASDEALAGRRINVVFSLDLRGDEPDDTLEEALEKVVKHGGAVRTERKEIGGDMGWYATVTDPSGLQFDLWTGRPAA